MEEDKNYLFDLELQSEIGFEIETGKVMVVDDTEPYGFLILKKYPQGLNRIAWKEADLLLFKEPDYSEEYWKEKIKKKLYEVCETNKLGDVNFAVIGDNLLDKSYKMTFNIFLKIYWNFFSIPQHTYVISEDGNYCLNYTFEDELYFGKGE